ncbi:MAG: hypothetical protein F6K09_08790, partial [Merismopedia sp. SIO2A8]|nr:hypothetical protein [Merismopedia sp. SIO2A8]
MKRYSPSQNPSPNRRRSPHLPHSERLLSPEHHTFSDITAGVLPSPSWVSSRGLDMCLLAVCSCA